MDLLILYGSQTGYAEDTARRISRQAWRRHFSSQVMAMDDMPDRSVIFDSQLVIFVCSTTGQGEEPDNMKKFWRYLLRKSIPADALHKMEFAVFGLGDSSYAKFNFPAKRLYRRLLQLGATALVERGDGDDQHYLGIDGALDPWLAKLWEVLLEKWPLTQPIIAESVVPVNTFDIDFIEAPVSNVLEDAGCYQATLTANKRITAPDHFQDTRHLRFGLTSDGPKWEPGDCAVFRPSNLSSDVGEFLAINQWQDIADRPISITPTKPNHPHLWFNHTQPVTLRWLLTNYFDIRAVPRRSFFEMLSYFADSEDEQDKLREFASTEGQDELHTYCMRPRRTVIETLGDFPHSRVPLNYLFDVYPAIAERSFSISSACSVTPRQVDLTVGIVRYKTLMQKWREGVCTRWMASMAIGQNVQVRFAKGTMKLPKDPAVPVIMVGPGTGVAAFMAYLKHRIESQQTDANYLFFGCRYHDKDFYYQETLERWVQERMLHLYTAFSRETHGRYVQDRIRENKATIWSLVEDQRAVVYVSGNANRMPEDVRQTFVDIIAEHTTNPEEYLKQMDKTGRYQEECWY